MSKLTKIILINILVLIGLVVGTMLAYIQLIAIPNFEEVAKSGAVVQHHSKK